MNMPPLTQSFVLHFGEMGSRWGVNRTVGQIYALLFVADRPLHADDIVEKLGMSRSNVSMGLKELQGWRLVRLSHLPGDRRDYFSAPEDVWTIFQILAEERQKREVEPTLSMLRVALLDAPESAEERHVQARMQQMYEVMELATGWFDELRKLSPQTLRRLMALGVTVQKLIDVKNKIAILPGGKSA